MSRRSIRKRRHLIPPPAYVAFERVTIGGVDVTETVSAVTYRQHRELVERRAAIGLGLAFDGTYRWPDAPPAAFEGTYRNPESPAPRAPTLAELEETIEEIRKLAPPPEQRRAALSYAWGPFTFEPGDDVFRRALASARAPKGGT